MKTSQEFIDEIKSTKGEQRTKDGRLIRDIDDRELMKKMLERYPGERDNIVDIDDYLGEEAKTIPAGPAKSDIQQRFDAVKKSPSFLERVKNRVVDTVGDVTETAKNLGGTISQGFTDIKDTVNRTDINPIQKVTASLGQAASTVSEGIGETTIGVGKALLSQKEEDTIQKLTQDIAGRIAETDTVQSISSKAKDWYNNLDTDNKLIVDSAGGMASFMSDVLGFGAGKQSVKQGINAVDTAIDVAKPVVKDAFESGVKTVDNALEPRRQAKIVQRKADIEDAVGRIIQGKPEDVAAAERAFKTVDTKGVKTYKELKDVMKDDVTTLSEKLDSLLETESPTPLKAEQLAQYIKVGDKTISQSPVQTALKELSDYYTKINDATNAEKVRQMVEKLDTDGLTLKEVNDIAKLHGRDLNGFNANGELASGLSKQAAENTRKGLKSVVRDRTTGDAAKAIDSQISDLLKTSKLVDEMEVKVQKLYQKIKNRTLAAKAGGAVADVLDLATMGTLRGFIAKLFPSNVGLKTANALDLEKELAKNLKKIDDLNSIEDPRKFSEAVSSYMDEVQPGLSTRIVSGLSAPEKDVLLQKLMSIDSQSVIKDGQVDLELFDQLEKLKKIADTRSLTEREYVELRQLMDEVNQE